MSNAKSNVRSRSIAKILFKYSTISLLVIITILVSAHFIWKNSGSSEWELVLDKNGVKVYAAKEPGSTVKKFRAFTRIKSTMTRAIAAMKDTSIETCAEWMSGCSHGVSVVPWNDQKLYFTHFYRLDMPSPLSPREFLLNAQFVPNPVDNSVFIRFMAQPDKLPRNECCYRVSHMNNSWRFTPVGNGEIDVEFMQDMSVGIPYFLYNIVGPSFVYDGLMSLPKNFNKEKYDDEKIPFLEDLAMID